MKVHTVTLPDGTTATRKSPRDYTHATIVISTPASFAAWSAKRDADEVAAINALTAVRTAHDAATVAEHAASLAALVAAAEVAKAAYYAAPSGYDGGDAYGSPAYTAKFQARERLLRAHCDADEAVRKHPVNALPTAEAQLAYVRARRARELPGESVGAAGVYGWSQSAKNGAAMAHKVAGQYALYTVRLVTTTTRETTPRVKKPT